MSETLVKSKERVAAHGEVFTPAWLVEDMLNLIKDETFRIDSRTLEPACGSGNFLCPVLERKLTTVRARYAKSDFENRHFALLALMNIYGIEILADNAAECRENLLKIFADYLKLNLEDDDAWIRAARAVLELNIVQGDARQMTKVDGSPLMFSEWAYLGKGKFQRRDFKFSHLTLRGAVTPADKQPGGDLFAELDDDAFRPEKTFPPLGAEEIGGAK